MKSIIKLIFILYSIHNSNAFLYKNVFPPTHQLANVNIGDVGQPLYLTPYIEQGKLVEARFLSEVHNLPNTPNIPSFSGFLTVNKTYNSNIFFWYFPALNNDTKAPLLLWLQGGPGSSSLYGLFVEHGPFVLDRNARAFNRNYTWNREFSVLYIDNPVGTGFSFTDDDAGYSNNQNDVAENLYSALQQFFTLFPNNRNNEFYITGESYGGKYVPAIAYKIHSEGIKSNIPLKGIAIGNGWIDPATQIQSSNIYYQIGILDETQRNYYKIEVQKTSKLIANKQLLQAMKLLMQLTDYTLNITGLTSIYNYVTGDPADFYYYPRYLGLAETRKALHVGDVIFTEGPENNFSVPNHFAGDFMNTVKPWLEVLLDNNYKVLIYSGQLDLCIPAAITENFIFNLNWSKSEQFKNVERNIWKVSDRDDEVAGYVRQVDKFYHIVVRNGGHILPHDQPRAAFDMITRFVRNNSFKNV